MSAIILRIIKREAPLDGTRDTCLQLPSTAQCVIISMFHFSIPQVFQLIQWSKTMHLLLTLRSHKRFHRGRRGFGFGWQLCSQAWDQRVGDGTARLDGPNLASYDCGVPNLHHGIPWKCTVNKPHQRHWTRQRVTMPGVSDLFKKLKRMYKWKPDVNSRIGLSTGLVSQSYFGLSIFFPKEKLSRRLIGPAPRDSEGDGWSKRSKCTLGFQVYPGS